MDTIYNHPILTATFIFMIGFFYVLGKAAQQNNE